MDDMSLKAVGTIRNDILQPILVAESGDLQCRAEQGDAGGSTAAVSELVIAPEFEGILDGIEDFSHVLVLYWAHFVGPEGRGLIKIHPMGRKDLPLVGVFSTCSPARPNPICISAVRILKRLGLTLTVDGLDAVNGSPIVDIKPYLPLYYAVENAKLSDWMNRILEEIGIR